MARRTWLLVVAPGASFMAMHASSSIQSCRRTARRRSTAAVAALMQWWPPAAPRAPPPAKARGVPQAARQARPRRPPPPCADGSCACSAGGTTPRGGTSAMRRGNRAGSESVSKGAPLSDRIGIAAMPFQPRRPLPRASSTHAGPRWGLQPSKSACRRHRQYFGGAHPASSTTIQSGVLTSALRSLVATGLRDSLSLASRNVRASASCASPSTKTAEAYCAGLRTRPSCMPQKAPRTSV